jgi:hypothetical protein
VTAISDAALGGGDRARNRPALAERQRGLTHEPTLETWAQRPVQLWKRQKVQKVLLIESRACESKISEAANNGVKRWH